MHKLQRTPPASPLLATSQSQSEPDLATCEEVEGTSNVTSRTKRPRMDASPPIADFGRQPLARQDLDDFKKDIMMMLSSWRSEQVASMARLTEDVAHVKKQCSEIHKTNSEIESSISSMKTQFEDIECKIKKLDLEKNETKEHIVSLGNQLNELQQLSRSSSIEIRNVPNKEKETEFELIQIIQKLGSILDVKIQDQDIRDVYRRPGKPGTPRSIVAEFTSVQVKDNILSSARRWNKSRKGSDRLNHGQIRGNGDLQPIYVDEHLPFSTHPSSETVKMQVT
ncbi:uncharacterized protein LOC135074259 [Ostrinia nubilalis]|uniref:uncharacterized protein LOC135074259 n=1 Tax=Ostrinia nubilalis TaxID=29057 RepID=UPI0030824629